MILSPAIRQFSLASITAWLNSNWLISAALAAVVEAVSSVVLAIVAMAAVVAAV